MKIFLTLFLILIYTSICGQEYYFINAKNGLNVRSNSNLSSTKVAKIPFGVLVEKIADTGKYLTVEDNGKQIKGKFIKIKYNNYVYLVSEDTKPFEREGYVFDGYLKKQKNKDIVSTVKIDKVEYAKLFKKANKTINKPKKIQNLDSIKTFLKNSVEWGNDESDGFMKSITTKNGQKLLLNNISNDYGFSEGASGYYSEYDILVLEGGHSSDMCFSIKTGETHFTIGNPEYIIPSPKGTYRLNGSFGGQECISYFFQKKENGSFRYLTEFSEDYDICTFKEFYWISETSFIYKKMNYTTDSENGIEEYFKGKINNKLETPNLINDYSELTKSPANGQKNEFNLIDAVLKNLNIKKENCKMDLVALKKMPNDSEKSIIVIPEIIEEGEHYFELSSYILIVNNVTGKIINTYFDSSKTNNWVSDAVRLAEITIDTAPYNVTDNKRAFGIRVRYVGSSQANPYEQETISLFIKEQNNLKQILKNFTVKQSNGFWDADCIGEFVDEKKALIISKNMTNGYFDVIVKTTTSNSIAFLDKNNQCDEKETISKKSQVLKYQKGIYQIKLFQN